MGRENAIVPPSVAVIVPCHNGGNQLKRCIEPLLKLDSSQFRLLIVDDASTDDVAIRLAQKHQISIATTGSTPVGPAMARNLGAAESADCDYLAFVDADIVVEASALPSMLAFLEANDDYSAVFGSYDDEPDSPGLVSRYKNLFHHYTHQQGNPEAESFWCGIGMVRQSVFVAFDGFSRRYARPSIEDVEFGFRLRRQGYRIALLNNVLGKHLKHWSLYSWLHTDIFCRAIPWSRLLVQDANTLPDTLNLGLQERLTALLAIGALGSMLLALVKPWFILPLLLCASGFLWLQRGFFGLLLEKGGYRQLGAGVVLHVGYYVLASTVFVLVWLCSRIERVFGRYKD